MQKVKRFCSQHYKRNLKFGFYIISLLLNSKTLNEAAEIFHDISIALLSQYVTNENRHFIDRLLQKINAFDTSVANFSKVGEIGAVSDEAKVGYYTEEHFISLACFPPLRNGLKALQMPQGFHAYLTKQSRKILTILRYFSSRSLIGIY